MSFRRLLSFYTKTALIVMNIIMLFLISNAAIAVLGLAKGNNIFQSSRLPETRMLPVYQTGSLKYGLSRLSHAYPNRTDEQIARLVLESWNVPLICDRDTLYHEQPFQGYYITVDHERFRWIQDQSAWPPDKSNYIIFLFGGSTTFGYGVSNEETIPSYLQRYLRELTRSNKISIYNFGHSFFFSLQERWEFQRLIQHGIVPDLAIFIDGLNDFYHWSGQPTYRSCKEPNSMSEKLRNTFVCRDDELCWPLQRFASQFHIDTLFERHQKPLAIVNEATPPPFDDRAANMAIIDRWLANKRAIEETAEASHVSTLFIVQPVPTYAYDARNHLFPDDLEQHGRSRWGYGIWETKIAADVANTWTANLVNLAHLGEGGNKALYVDPVHYTAAFADKIASAIADDIASRGLTAPQRH